MAIGYRYQNSFRHFRGSHQETQRVEQGTQVENDLHLVDIALSYRMSPRWSLSVSAPFSTVKRTSHRNDTVTQSTGVGDMSIGARAWIWRPPTESRQNVQVGFGVKLPTGRSNVTNLVGPNRVVVDQSIQLGDSGTGVSVDFMAFKSIQRFTLFANGAYLANPKNMYTPQGWDERVPRDPSRGYLGYSAVGTAYSVADQYLLSGGLGWAVPKVRGFALTSVIRAEGVPARDLIGREDGFRRPGYAISVGPGVMYSRGAHTWSVSAPIAVYRNRTRSVLDVRRGPNVHGDAAFADYVLLIGYSRSF
jgi:hypothetical protein